VKFLTGWVNGSRQMSFAVPCFGGNQKAIHLIVTLFNKCKRDHFQIQMRSEISRFIICIRPVPHSEEFAYAKVFGKSDF